MKEEKRLNKPDRCVAFPVATLEGEGYYYTENNDFYRIGVTLNPEPIMTIEGKEYRIERARKKLTEILDEIEFGVKR